MRIKTYKKRVYTAVMLPFLLLGFGVLGLAKNLQDQGREAREADKHVLATADGLICNAVNENRKSFRRYVQRIYEDQKEALPQISYYQEHPDELQEALDRLEDQQDQLDKDFEELHCEHLVKTGDEE